MNRSRLTRFALCCIALAFITGCSSMGSPVSITNRPLSERIDERASDLSSSTSTPVDVGNEASGSVPDAIAFSNTLASGDFLRLTVNTNGVDTSLRNGPGSSYTELATLSSGDEVLATGNQTGEWVFVVYGDFEGWMSNRRLSFGDATAADVVVEAEDVDKNAVVYEVSRDVVAVNIRAAADEDSALVSGAPLGSELVGTGQTDGSWVEVIHNDATGWVSSSDLTATRTVNVPLE